MRLVNMQKAADRRKRHVRKKITGTRERPRLSVFRSSRHIYAQIIDDVAGVTLVSVGTNCKPVRDQVSRGSNIKAAAVVGEALGKRALDVGIQCIRFDRNRYRYHGRIKALAEAARKAGLVF